MRKLHWAFGFLCTVCPIVACAAAEENSGTPEPMPEADSGPDADASTSSSDASADVTAYDADDGAPSLCTSDGFCHTAVPEHQNLRAVWGDGTGVAWAVSAEGHVLRWDGAAWSVVFSTPKSLDAIWGSGPTDIWIGGQDGLFHGQGPSSSAITWAASPQNDGVVPVLSIWGSGPNDVWAVGARADYNVWPQLLESRVLHYAGPGSDPATAWSLDPLSSRPYLFTRVWGDAKGVVWIGGDQGNVSPPLPALVLRKGSANGVDAGGADGGDGWAAESLVPDTGNDVLYRVSGGAILGDDLCVVGRRMPDNYAVLWVGENAPGGAVTWKDESSFDTNHYLVHNAAWGSSGSDFYVAGMWGRLRQFDGSQWRYPKISIDGFPIMNDFNAMWGKVDAELWIVGADIALHKKFTKPK